MKINLQCPEEENCTTEDTVEEIFTVDGIIDGCEENASFKVNEKETEDSAPHFNKDRTEKMSESCKLEDMVKNYVIQQLSSYVWSEVAKKLEFSSVNYRSNSGRKGKKLLGINKEIFTNISSDSESEFNSTEENLFRTLQPKRGHVSTTLSENCLEIKDPISSQSLFEPRKYRLEYPSFTVIGSAPVSLPPPRAAYSSAHEMRSFHSAAERSKKQYADRRFSCDTPSNEKTSDRFHGLNTKNQRHTSSNYSNKNSRQYSSPDSPNTLNKHLVLPPINKVDSQKMTSYDRQNRFQRVDNSGYFKIYQGFVTQEDIENSLQIRKFDKQKKEQRLKKTSYPERL